MKVLSYIISLCLLWSTGAMAFAPGFLQTCTSGAVSSCSASTNEVGERTEWSTESTIQPTYAWATRVQADCSGALNTASVYKVADSSTTENIRILIYTSTNSSLSSDTNAQLVAYSDVIPTTAGVAWKTSSLVSGGNVTSGNYYWLVVASANTNGGNYKLGRSDTGETMYYKADVNIYSSPPSTLSNSGWDTIAYGKLSIYVSIGN